MTTATNPSNSAIDEAMGVEWTPRPKVFFGQVEVDSYYCALVKGMGKVPFDAGIHKPEQRCTAITIALNPLPDSPITSPVQRDLIAESKEWGQIVKPSLRALSVDLRSINGKWAQAEMVPTGRNYTNKSGEEKALTTFKFLAIYSTEAECVAAADRFFVRVSGPQDAPDGTPAPQAATTNSSAERATAAKFLPALWAQSGKDVVKFGELIAKLPLVAKHFDLMSPEVLTIIAPF